MNDQGVCTPVEVISSPFDSGWRLRYSCGTTIAIKDHDVCLARGSARAFRDLIDKHRHCPVCAHRELDDPLEAFRIASGGAW